jgi:hypothetical protein
VEAGSQGIQEGPAVGAAPAASVFWDGAAAFSYGGAPRWSSSVPTMVVSSKKNRQG